MIIAYVIVQSGCSNILPLIVALQDFVNDQIYEECAPMATFESAIRVVEFEFHDKVVDYMSFHSFSDNQLDSNSSKSF